MQRALDRISRVASQLVYTAIMTSASTVTSPAWRTAVLTALKKNGKHMPYVKYFQMATVKPDGRPHEPHGGVPRVPGRHPRHHHGH